MYAKEVERNKEQYEPYNIIPLFAIGIKPPIMELPEVFYILSRCSFALLCVKLLTCLSETSR